MLIRTEIFTLLLEAEQSNSVQWYYSLSPFLLYYEMSQHFTIAKNVTFSHTNCLHRLS